MGQPFWDYWLPHAFAARGRRVCAVEFPAAYHRNHPRQWSFEAWHRCALEFDRMAGLLGADRSFQACSAMSVQVRAAFEEQRLPLSPRPPQIRDWVQARFAGNEPKTFLELGAHCGDDTAWMASLPGVTVHAFEPDPRNHPPPRPNVLLHRAAISDRDGRAPFLLSREGWGREWTYSSSIKQPKNHLRRYPVSFGETVEVETVTLDSHVHRHGIAAIDFIWADIQGAEGEMIRGGRRALERTRYLFTEYSDDEMYEGQPTLAEILRLLPGFRVLELWQDDVLLENRARA
jgi:FkbM family methyltransferase